MPATRGTMFFFGDWLQDPGLSLCSLQAQGLWARMFCLCGISEERGFLLLAGKPASTADLAALVHRPVDEVENLLQELESRRVFSRDKRGAIYNRRLVRDEKIRRENVKNGKKGGNPSLRKKTEKTEPDNPPTDGGDKAILSLPILSKKEETRSNSESNTSKTSVNAGSAKRPSPAVSPLPLDWKLSPEQAAFARDLGLDDLTVRRAAVAFLGYWTAGKGTGTKRSAKGWKQAWMNWVQREAEDYRSRGNGAAPRHIPFEG